MKSQLPEISEKIFKSKKRYVIIYGGRGSGKTESMGQMLVLKSATEECRIVCGREKQNSIAESSKSVIEKWIKKLGLSKIFKITKMKIVCTLTGSEFIFLGLNNQSKDSLASIDNIKYLWIEEGHTITKETWDRVYPSIRAPESQIFVTFNPHKPEDVIYNEFILNKRENADVIKMNWKDNPWFKLSPLYEEMMIDRKSKPLSFYLHVWEGELNEYNPNPIIDSNRFGYFYKGLKYSEIYLSLDTAFSVKESADYSVIGAFGKYKDEVHLLRILRGRWEFSDLRSNLMYMYQWISDHYRSPRQVIIENKASGYSLIQEIQRYTNIPISKFDPTKDKFARVCEVLPFLHSGKFKLPIDNDPLNSWVKDYKRELDAFTADDSHEHDDQVDVTTMAIFNMVNQSSNYKEWLRVNYN